MPHSKTRFVRQLGERSADQRVALVTGAAGGLGAAIVDRLGRAGVAVVLVDREGDKALNVAVQADVVGAVIEADLQDTDAIAEIFPLLNGSMGRMDYLVNNAGLNRPQTLRDINIDSWEAVLAINLRAPMLLAKQAIPYWEASGAGSIVNIASRVWLSGATPAYTASKAGIVGLTRSLAVELGRINVRVNAVAPSYVDTAFTRLGRSETVISTMQSQVMKITPLPRIGTPEDIANAVAFLLSDEAAFITGEVLHVCGGAQLAAQSYSFGERSS